MRKDGDMRYGASPATTLTVEMLDTREINK